MTKQSEQLISSVFCSVLMSVWRREFLEKISSWGTESGTGSLCLADKHHREEARCAVNTWLKMGLFSLNVPCTSSFASHCTWLSYVVQALRVTCLLAIVSSTCLLQHLDSASLPQNFQTGRVGDSWAGGPAGANDPPHAYSCDELKSVGTAILMG